MWRLLTAKLIKQFNETHRLKHKHDKRREKRHVVATHSQIHQIIQQKLTV